MPNLDLPTPNGDRGQWGYKTNAALSTLSSAVDLAALAASEAGAAALAASGAAAALPGSLGDPGSVLATNLRADWVDFVRPEIYGAVGDGVTNDTAPVVAAVATGQTVRLAPGKTYLVDPDAIVLQAGQGMEGASGGGPTYQSGKVTKVKIRSTGGSIGISCGTGGFVRNLVVLSENLPLYTDADYPVGSPNATTGLLAGGSAVIDGVGAYGFSRGIGTNSWTRVNRCWARGCDYGFYAVATDGFLTNSIATFCMSAGLYSSNYFRSIGNRFEWNARYGIDSAGEATIVGNLFDRNGWAGVYCRSGAWGQVITGNYFARNGCGGDASQGTSGLGRWGFSNAASASWVATDVTKSCHVEINYQRGVTLSGNRYRAGSDDSGQGATAPAYVYSSTASNGSTSGTSVATAGETGVRGVDSLGYSTSAYSGVGKVAGGSDTGLAQRINARGAYAAVTWNPPSIAAGASTSTSVTVPGAYLSDAVTVATTASISLGGCVLSGYISATDTVTLVLFNPTASAVDLGSGSFRAVLAAI